MDEKLRIIVSSFSDCREKNGIVTFTNILRNNAGRFSEHGFRLVFASYVDDGRPQVATVRPAPAPTPAVAEPGPLRRLLPALKYAVKAQLAKRPLLAFLLMMTTLSRRGLVVAMKARRLDGPDSLHFHQDAFTAMFAQWVLRRGSRRVLMLHSGNDSLRQIFLHFHGMRGTRYETLVRNQFRRLLAGLDGIVTLNEQCAATLREQFPGVDVRCIYNTSPFANQSSASRPGESIRTATAGRRIKILAVGSLQPIKGFDLLVAAAAELPQADRARLRITIVGAGAERSSLQAAIDAAGLREVVILNGESDDVGSFLASADAYVLSSRDEGFPIALIEASDFGLPIIATRVGSIPEVFDEGSCRFMEPTVDSIRDALADVARGTADLGELARGSRRVFDTKLSLDAFLQAYCTLFDDMERRHAH